MDSSEKKELSEIDICDLFITPAIKEAGWDQLTQIRREVTLAPGRSSFAAMCPLCSLYRRLVRQPIAEDGAGA